ncbi:hypothetical protein UCDDS831_g07485 [Diplodia seriata]|uniref:Uncharacterized protein n=1 Tax=Diplodia seriata TaxID=420778 RepID=A0A0G2GFC0_9PEZI|nr:hypothetical protein UCDDS831_g07485 [Diplodia seriata]
MDNRLQALQTEVMHRLAVMLPLRQLNDTNTRQDQGIAQLYQAVTQLEQAVASRSNDLEGRVAALEDRLTQSLDASTASENRAIIKHDPIPNERDRLQQHDDAVAALVQRVSNVRVRLNELFTAATTNLGDPAPPPPPPPQGILDIPLTPQSTLRDWLAVDADAADHAPADRCQTWELPAPIRTSLRPSLRERLRTDRDRCHRHNRIRDDNVPDNAASFVPHALLDAAETRLWIVDDPRERCWFVVVRRGERAWVSVKQPMVVVDEGTSNAAS